MPAKKLSAAEAKKAKAGKETVSEKEVKAKKTKAGPKSGRSASKDAAKKPAVKKASRSEAKTGTRKGSNKPAAKKVKVTQKAAREAETRLKWNPQPVEGAKWYVVQTASNYEKRVQTLIREQLLLQGMQRFVEDVVIPMEPVTEVKKGVKVSAERKFFPGYVLVKCIMNDEVWHLIRHTPHVSSFMGADFGRKPQPLKTSEAERILNQMQHGAEKPRNLITFEVGEEVRVMEGPFANFQGAVELVDEEKERLTVAVSIFGRATPIELDFSQVEKA